MRMTNKIMRNNSLYNINQNKILEDRLSNSMTNQSKITRPSDDPVVAIRALRLRTNVSTVSQYYDKNAPDADSWLSVTGDALDTVGAVLKSLYSQVTDASKKSLTYADLKIIYEQMDSLTKEFYASGNVDYAGRYVFSGFRTDTPITFTEENIMEFNHDPENRKTYMIEENLGYSDISSISYTNWENAADEKLVWTDERDVTNTTLYRFRLAYNNLNMTTKNSDGTSVNNGDTVNPNDLQIFMSGGLYTPTVKVYDNSDSAYEAVSKNPAEVAYIPSTGEIVFSEEYYKGSMEINGKTVATIAENMQIRVKYSKTDWQAGDINPVHYFHSIGCNESTKKDAMKLENAEDILSRTQNIFKKLNSTLDKLNTGDLDDIEVADTYAGEAASSIADLTKKINEMVDKGIEIDQDTIDAVNKAQAAVNAARTAVNAAEAAKPDINTLLAARAATRTAIDDTEKAVDTAQIEVNRIRNNLVEYNADEQDQDIYYDVGFNQEIQVNTHADEVFTHGVRRDADDFTIYLEQLRVVEAKISDLEYKITEAEKAGDTDAVKNLNLKLDAAQKAYTYIRDNVQTRFENQITKYQKYIDDTNVAVTNNGTRGSRLDLISSRLMSQKATFKDLQSNNEDVDVSEVAVQLKSSELTYEAALMATSKIMQTNLMNYI